MNRRLIYFATQAEAQASLSALQTCPGKSCDTHLYDNGLLVVGGIGLLAAMHALSSTNHLPFEEVWNLGVAGSLSSTHSLGELVAISIVTRSQLFPASLDSRSRQWQQNLFPPLKTAHEIAGQRLVTCDYPIHQADLRLQLAQQADLVDMEGYAVAFLANQWGKPCYIWKVVSDFAGEGGPEVIKGQLKLASERLAILLSDEGVG